MARDDPRKILKNIEKYIKSGKYQNAINEYLKLLQINPKDLAAINQLGDLYVRVGNYREAYKYYKKLAEYYEKTDVIPKSIAIYRKIYRLDPKNIEVAFKLGELFQRIGAEVDAKKIYIDVAEYLKFQKKTDEVLKVYKKLAELDRENIEILTTLAELYKREFHPQGAAETYAKIAEIYKKKGNIEKSIENYKLAFNLDQNLFYLNALVDVYKKSGQLDKAIEFVEKIKDNNEKGEFKKLLSQLYLENKEYEKAEKILLELSKDVDISDVEPYEYLGKLYVTQGNYQKAFEIINPIVDLLVENNKENKAQELLNVILTKEPQFLPALEKKAEIFEKFGKENSLMLVLVSIAEVYETNKEYEKAKEIYQKLLVMDPTKEEFRFELERLDKLIKGEDEGDVGGIDEDEKKRRELEEKTIVGNLSQFVKIFESGFKEEAIREVQNLSEMYPSNPRIKEQLLDFLIKNNSLDQALKTGHQLIEIYERLGDKESISAIVERLIKYFPNDPLLNTYLTTSETEISFGGIEKSGESEFKEDEKKIEEILGEIDFFISNNFIEEAKKAVEKALESHPGNVELLKKKSFLENIKKTAPFKKENEEIEVENKETGDELGFEDDTAEIFIENNEQEQKSTSDNGVKEEIEDKSEEEEVIEDEIEIDFDLSLEEQDKGKNNSIDSDNVKEEKERKKVLEQNEEELVLNENKEKIEEEKNDTIFEEGLNEGQENGLEGAGLTDNPDFDDLDFDFDLAENKIDQQIDTSDDLGKIVEDSGLEEQDLEEEDILNLDKELEDFSGLLEGEDIFDVPESYYYEVGTVVSDEIKAIKDVSEEAKDNVTTTMEKNLDDILSQFKEKLEDTIEKEDYATRYNLGIAYFGMGLYDEAINDFLISSKSEKFKFDSFVHLGLSFYKKGVFSEAERWFKEALKIPGRTKDEYLSLKYELANIFEIEGKISEAIQLLDEIVKEDPNYRDSKKKLESLHS